MTERRQEDAVTGLDALVSLTPETGVVGGIDRETATYWRDICRHRDCGYDGRVRWQPRWKASGAAVSAMAVRRDFILARFRFYRCLSPSMG